MVKKPSSNRIEKLKDIYKPLIYPLNFRAPRRVGLKFNRNGGYLIWRDQVPTTAIQKCSACVVAESCRRGHRTMIQCLEREAPSCTQLVDKNKPIGWKLARQKKKIYWVIDIELIRSASEPPTLLSIPSLFLCTLFCKGRFLGSQKKIGLPSLDILVTPKGA